MDMHRECAEQYGSIYREIFVPGIEFVHISDPKDIEEVFRSDSQHPIRQAFFMLSHYNKKYNENVQGLLTRFVYIYRICLLYFHVFLYSNKNQQAFLDSTVSPISL